MVLKQKYRRVFPMAWCALALCFSGFTVCPLFAAQAAAPAAKPDPDVLIFTDGEKLIGKLVRSSGGSVVFHSDMAGDITVDWSKIKELHSSQEFAIVQNGVKLGRHDDTSRVPQGQIAVTDQKIEITPKGATSPETIPVAKSAYLIDEATFQKAVLAKPHLYQGWTGAITGGASLVEATQSSRTFTGNIALVRAIPSENWLDRRNRMLLDFSAAYGVLQQPNTPDVKTEIYHGSLERDDYFTSRVFVFEQAQYDHNYSQGLDLQQSYGGGLGWTVLKTANSELDLKASLSYVRQQFTDAGQDQNLFGSTFGETYSHKFSHNILFLQDLAVTPAWNNLEAYSAVADATLTMPIYKRLNISVGTVDNFLNNPPPGFKKNSFQLTTGITYVLP